MNIKELRKKFGMSQDELAGRLNMSRPTLINLENGTRPIKLEEKAKIQEIFELIKENEAEMKSDMRIDIPQKKLDKFKQVFLYILEKVGGKPNVGLTVLYKLLYFIDFDYYEKYEEQLMGLTYIKNHHGPTPKEFIKVVEEMKEKGEIEEVKSPYFKYEQRKYLSRVSADLSQLNGRELEMIDSVLSRLSDKSATELSEYSHRDVPWMTHEEGEQISYESVFYRNDPYSVRQYEDEI
ncbi:XRE family transcriptional regulator [Candidatus Peregrinibacteria bacterium CG_4_10_14_0_2_um_filter_38_24]|nr:MAG: XRE family transcriptional regulator [Candidatus Peregrinibacteria bacterium CG_4_10_14_0_2_um_filter_38_24]